MNGWVVKLALRDGRRGMKALSFAMACVVLGVASIVSVGSFRENLTSGIQEQSKSLLGADLSIDSRQPFSQEAETLIDSLGGARSRQLRFSSMAYFPASENSRLVQVRALDGGFPYYGALETDPPQAASEFRSGANALVDETLMLQFNAELGDRVKIGEQDFRIAGKLRKIPGETLAFSLISPRIYIPLAHLDRTRLLQRGSIVRYRVYFKLDPTEDADRLVERLSPQFLRLGLEAETAARRAASLSHSMENLSRYLYLAVFIAVLLAGVGAASAIHVYAKEKTSAVAMLRCIGATPRETVAVYLAQALAVALVGSLLGAALGIALQSVLSLALEDFLPVQSRFSFAPAGILMGIATGLGTTLLFALLPLVALRNVSPLLALRSMYEDDRRPRDPLIGSILFLIVAGVLGVSMATAERWWHGVWFTAGVLGAFGSLALLARGTSTAVKKVAPDFLPYPWRQGLANLYRPNNQTTAVTLAIGLGTFLLVTLYGARGMLLEEVARRSGADDPDLVLFDVQRDQREALAALLKNFNAPVHETVPVVTMRLAAINGKQVEAMRADPESKIPRWALRREYRSTYRSRLAGTERLIGGAWVGKVAPDAQPIPISLEQGIAQTLGVALGDRLEFQLQGVPLPARVASIRQVDWQRVQPNFFVVFPEGVLETAPQFYALTTRADSRRLSAAIQRAVVEGFPNVSMIDLTLVLSTLESVLSRISDAIRFIALFIVLTGFAVLAGAVLSSRSQRIKESILMRTLGASRSQIVQAIVAEYLFLGLIAATAGVVLGAAAGWGLTFYFLGTAPALSIAPLLAIPALAVALTVAAGVLGCWGIFRRSALEALRAEA